MKSKFLLTPYFLDGHRQNYQRLRGRSWAMNEAPLADGPDVQHRVIPIYETIAEFMRAAVEAGDMPVSVAGDCVATIGALAGLQRAQLAPTLIWFDAHGDFNTWETTPSEFLGGMPLAMMAGLGEQTLMQALNADLLPAAQIILTDGRDLDPGEAELVANSGIVHLADTAELLTCDLPDGPIYVHFDADIMRLSDAPAVSYPADGGPELETLRQVMARIRATGRVVGVSVSLTNPNMDEAARSEAAAMSVLEALVGDLD